MDDVAAEYAAATVQALHVEDLLEHIPVIKMALVAAKIIGGVRDHLLLKKIGIYSRALSIIPARERPPNGCSLAADLSFKEDLGEHLIELLDRLAGRRKPSMVGTVFAAYAFEAIDSTVVRRLNCAVQILSAMEINQVRLLDDERINFSMMMLLPTPLLP